MSLKAFHIVFIIAASLLCAVMAAWGWNEYNTAHSGVGLSLAITGAVGLALLIPYYRWFRKKILLVICLPFILSPMTAEACAVCFGDPNSPMTKGLKVGILMLLAVITSILVAIASIGFTWSRRAKALGQP